MITLQNVSKIFGTGVAGLSDINLQIDKGEFVFLVGQTGSGKTTLLRMLIKEVIPTKGVVIVGGWDLNKLPGHKIPHLRKKIGVVFQDLKLLMDRTILENILLPLQVAGVTGSEAKNRAEELLEHAGISMHRDKFPIQLSGGELQRAAIARALSLSPDILLADEPTGNLDAATAFDIVSLLSKINQHGTTIIMATHNMDIVEKLGNRVVVLDKGVLIKDEKSKKKENHKEKSEEKIEAKEAGTTDKKVAEEPSAEKKEHDKHQESHKKEEHKELKKHESVKEEIPLRASFAGGAPKAEQGFEGQAKETHEKTVEVKEKETKVKKKPSFGGFFNRK